MGHTPRETRLAGLPDRFAVAALSICESLILALRDRGVLDDAEIQGLLEDVSSAHRCAAADGEDPVLHDSVADIADEILRGGNSIRLLRKGSRSSGGRSIKAARSADAGLRQQQGGGRVPRRETAGAGDDARQVEPQLPSLGSDSLPLLIRCSDDQGGCSYVNRQWLSVTGRRTEDELGAGWIDAVHPDDREDCLRVLERARDGRQPVSIEYRLRQHDGVWRWLHEQAVPYSIVDGVPGVLHLAFDVTAHRDGAARLRERFEHQQAALGELRHRAVNRSQLILSLLRLQARDAAEPGVREALEAAAVRVQTLAHADLTLAAVPDGAAPQLRDCLHELAASLRTRFEQRAVSLELSVDDSEIPPHITVPLELLVSELLMNSLRHAFPEQSGGTVKLVGTRVGDRLKIVVADDGAGGSEGVEAQRARRNEMWLIDSLAKQIDAEMSVERDGGSCFVLTVPIA